MNISEFMKACSDLSKEYHIKYMAWLKTQDLTKAKPDVPIFEITREQECDLKVDDQGGILFDWRFEKPPITLDGREFYGVKIKVIDDD